MPKHKMIFTTSWDDGYKDDFRIARMLERHNATGTFYVSPLKQHEQAMLSAKQIKDLDSRHEVGAHTMHHPHLADIDIAEASKEIRDSKLWVEQITGRPCKVFSYPYGSFSTSVRDAVAEAGFLGARTVRQLRFSADNPFEMHTSIHLMPPWQIRYTRFWRLFNPLFPLRAKWRRLNELHIPLLVRRNWQHLARAVFTYALETEKPYFHLWGHAFELDHYCLWEELDDFLGFVKNHSLEHLTNGQLVRALRK